MQIPLMVQMVSLFNISKMISTEDSIMSLSLWLNDIYFSVFMFACQSACLFVKISALVWIASTSRHHLSFAVSKSPDQSECPLISQCNSFFQISGN